MPAGGGLSYARRGWWGPGCLPAHPCLPAAEPLTAQHICLTPPCCAAPRPLQNKLSYNLNATRMNDTLQAASLQTIHYPPKVPACLPACLPQLASAACGAPKTLQLPPPCLAPSQLT
jgi:hypothetical protein